MDTVKDVNGRREFPLSENKIGYVRLTQFGEQTADDFEDALRKLPFVASNPQALDMMFKGIFLDEGRRILQ
mgnify:CR=1 FL=1